MRRVTAGIFPKNAFYHHAFFFIIPVLPALPWAYYRGRPVSQPLSSEDLIPAQRGNWKCEYSFCGRVAGRTAAAPYRLLPRVRALLREHAPSQATGRSKEAELEKYAVGFPENFDDGEGYQKRKEKR